MAGPGSLVHQVQESIKSLCHYGESKRAWKLRRQAEILQSTGQAVPLPRIVLDEIFSIRTTKTYINLAIGFVKWCRQQYGIRYLTQIRMAEMGTRYVREQFLSRTNPSGWTVRTVLAAIAKLSAGVKRRYGCDIGQVNRAALGTLPARDKLHKQQAGEYPAEDAQAIIEWVASRRSHQAQLAALILELQWRCGLRVSEAAGLRARMVDDAAAVLRITNTNITKGARDRAVPLPIPPELLDRLVPLVQAAAAHSHEARIFRVCPGYVRWRVRQACRVLGIRRHGTHGYRYRFCNDRMDERLRQGIARFQALRDTSEELGHSRPGAAMTYSNQY